MAPSLPPLSQVLDLLPDAVCIVDEHGQLLFVNVAFERLLGYAATEVHGRLLFDFIHPDDRDATLRQARALMEGGGERHFRNRYLHRQGHAVDLLWSAHWLPEQRLRIGVAREIGELQRAERELEHHANHDPLTGLANRRRLELALRNALAEAAESSGQVSLLYVDLAGFKQVNDRDGHEAGDRVLCEVAKRLQQGVRQIDLVARIGGDEFVVLLPGCDAGHARGMAQQLCQQLRVPCALRDGPLRMDASIGIATFPADGRTPDALLAHADKAMYASRGCR
ncbi:sensor domain-containing diguanylate cyclase [Thermomonas fusca]|uniref:Sensor domain-containing diguanylate cyclase n=1 Tax=Thermomonas fusca TaxID=215690 RepID=A0A5R9PFT4_9GAMM|nr:sensor domain-containing diguanylate cyclase [Thermomonas fusca]TLX22242.1 sensor domain-containing diguanylate cyclase [Thermomonas fusca]